MEELQKQVRRAVRRMTLQRFLNLLGWSWMAFFFLAAVLIVLEKYHFLPLAPWIPGTAALVLGLLVALGGAWLFRKKSLEAAIEIDQRFGLKERVSSAWALDSDERASEAGQAVLSDAAHRVSRLEISEKFPVRPSGRLFLPLLPAILVFLGALLWNPIEPDQPAQAKTNPPSALPIKKAAESMQRQLIERKKKAKEEGLEDAELLFKKMEEGVKQLADRSTEREKALSKLNDLSRQLLDRRRQIGDSEKLKDLLNPLKNLDQGPAQQLAKALGQKNFNKAIDELKKMQKAIGDKKLDPKEKEKLAQQLEQMKKTLDDLAKNHQKAREEMQKKADELRKNGQNAEAEQLDEQIKQMQDQAPQMQQFQKMADQLAQAAQGMMEGKSPQADEAMQQAMQALEQMKKQEDELQMLDGALGQLNQMKDQMNCAKCQGEGCGECQGQMPGRGSSGKGKGEGERPESKTDTSFYDSRVRPKVGKGTGTFSGMVEGVNLPGNVQTQIQEQVDSTRRGDTNPLTGRPLPKKHSQQTQEYFDSFREGK